MDEYDIVTQKQIKKIENLICKERVKLKNFKSTLDTTASTSVLDLTNVLGIYYTGPSGAAKSLTTYTTTGTTLGAFTQVLINTTSEPTVDGSSSPISGASWTTGVDMYMIVTYNGTRVEFFFLEI